MRVLREAQRVADLGPAIAPVVSRRGAGRPCDTVERVRGAAKGASGPALDSTSLRILETTRDLVRIPSQGGIDDAAPICAALVARLAEAGLVGRVLMDGARPVGVVAEIVGAHPGPAYALNAVVDTAPVGDAKRWSTQTPFSAELRGNRLYGRGVGDSKVAAAMFIEVGRVLAQRRDAMHGRAILFFDAAEHAGDFAGMRAFVTEYATGARRVQGMVIGYPGNESLQIGSRGFHRSQWRMTLPRAGSCADVARAIRAPLVVPLPEARSLEFPLSTKLTPTAVSSTSGATISGPGVVLELCINGKAAHSGASASAGVNALAKTADVLTALAEHAATIYGAGVEPRVLSLTGGKDFSVVPDQIRLRLFVPTQVCGERGAEHLARLALEKVDALLPGGVASTVASSSKADGSERAVDAVAINVDVRTTTRYDVDDVQAHHAACAELVRRAGFGCEQEPFGAWPAFRLPDQSPLVSAMKKAIDAHNPKAAQARISGPSNAGNVAAAYGIPATAGFGATCRHAHGTDESIDITTIPTALAVHVEAMETLLGMR